MLSDVVETCRVLRALTVAEFWRQSMGPARSVERARARGRTCARRSGSARARLRQLIRMIDARLPDSGNCYRRALAEMALDPDSAVEQLHFGLMKAGGPRSGHAWLASDAPESDSYDAEFTI